MRRPMRSLWMASALAASSIVIGTHAVSAGQTHPRPAVVYRVQPGDTLWSIASKLVPTKDPREIVDGLLKANHLASPTIVPGQSLRFPAP